MIDLSEKSNPRRQRTENPPRQHRDRLILLLLPVLSSPDIPRHALLTAMPVIRVQQPFLVHQQSCQQEPQARANVADQTRGNVIDYWNVDDVHSPVCPSTQEATPRENIHFPRPPMTVRCKSNFVP